MDNYITGNIIKKFGVSDKTISKWESSRLKAVA